MRLTEEGRRITRAALAASARAHQEVTAGVPEESLRRAADALRDILVVVGRHRFR